LHDLRHQYALLLRYGVGELGAQRVGQPVDADTQVAFHRLGLGLRRCRGRLCGLNRHGLRQGQCRGQGNCNGCMFHG